jgi:hypothetical protein
MKEYIFVNESENKIERLSSGVNITLLPEELETYFLLLHLNSSTTMDKLATLAGAKEQVIKCFQTLGKK